ncbi:MAG: ABC transporter substrate-binding protein [Flavobacteriaceae bacterium]
MDWRGSLGAAILVGAGLVSLPSLAADAVKFGYVLDASGPTQDISKPTLDGFNLYIDKVNAAGGVDGRKIEVDVRDVQLDTQRAVVTSQQLAEEGAVAIIGLPLSSTQMGIYQSMAKAGTPVVAGFPSNIRVIAPPAMENAFGIGVMFDLMGWIGGDLLRDAAPAGKSMVCTTFESPGGLVSCKGGEAAAKKDGFEKTESVTFPIAQRDFRGIAERIASINPDVVLTVLGRGRTLAMLPALSEAGYKGIVLSMEAGTGDDIVRQAAKAAPGIEIYSYTRYVAEGYGSGAQVDALAAAAKAAGHEGWTAAQAGGWTLGMLVEDLVKRCADPCTAEKIQKALVETDLDTGGLTGGPIRFTDKDHYGSTYYMLVKYDRDTDAMKPVGDWREYSSEIPEY